MSIEEKFIARNTLNLEKLNEFIAANRNDIVRFVTSVELNAYLSKMPLATHLRSHENEIRIKYDKIRVVVDVYAPAGSIYPIMKNNRFAFEMPCVCGYFKDEQHP
jgi:hypothetical protein